MLHVPRWFKRELSFIDPTYYVKKDSPDGPYAIMKDADIYIKFRDGTVYKTKEPRVVDSFMRLNDAALTHLRYRKWLGRQMKIIENPGRELAYLEAQEKAAMAKERELGNDMAAEGFHEGYRLSKKHSVS